jgi:hypothetical protein
MCILNSVLVWLTALNSSHNDRFKTYRKMMHHTFNPAASQMYWEVQEHEARVLVDIILKSPDDLSEHLRRQVFALRLFSLR